MCLDPGESISLRTGVYHSFWAVGAPVVAGEVSRVNDDVTDNVFYEELGRFPDIVEDEEPLRLLVGTTSVSAGDGVLFLVSTAHHPM